MRIFIYFAFLSLVALAACEGGEKVLTTPGGYEYINHTSTNGEVPQAGDYVYFHAQMRSGDSVLYGSRMQGADPFIQIPEAEMPGRQSSPVEDVLKVLSVGDSATVMINLDTLPQKPRGFEDVSIMYYDVVVTEILDKEAYGEKLAAERAEQEQKIEELKGRKEEVFNTMQEKLKAYQDGSLADLQETDSGLKYVVLKEGDGTQAEPGKTVDTHYYGVLASDGKEFDTSFTRGQTFPVVLGQNRVIKGWEEGLSLFKAGTQALLFIPSELGYGERGAPPTIPENAELLFYVELVDVK